MEICKSFTVCLYAFSEAPETERRDQLMGQRRLKKVIGEGITNSALDSGSTGNPRR